MATNGRHTHRRPRMPATIGRVAAAVLVTVLVTALVMDGAAAQDALGDGHALDRNLDPNSGGYNFGRPARDYGAGNLIITNSVAGGRGFRESVGYTAAEDFRGDLGSNDLYQFRAGSAFSDVNFMNYGSTYQRFRFGEGLGLLEYRRAGGGASALDIRRAEMTGRDVLDQVRFDQFVFSSSINESSAFAIEPATIGGYLDEAGDAVVVQASSLNGLSSTPVSELSQYHGLSTFDHARIYEDAAAGRLDGAAAIGAPFAGRFEDLLVAAPPVEDRVEPGRIGGTAEEVREAQDSAFRRIQERIASLQAQEVPGASPDDERILLTLDEEIAQLRARLAQEQQERLAARQTDPLGTAASDLTGGDGGETEEGADEEAGPKPLDQRRIEDFGLILRHGQRIGALSSGDATRFDELMSSAEARLRDGEYFWAERRFNRALRFAPGHPLATAGLAHSQIGAGLHMAASLTLRSLFTFQPEMIDARYDEGLVPNRLRLEKAVDAIRHRIEAKEDEADYGMMLAYLGRLLDRRELVEEGLGVMAEATPDDPLLALLRAVWLGAPQGGGDASENHR